MGAAAKFAAAGKSTGKKDLAMLAMAYGNVYVATRRLRRQGRADREGLREADPTAAPRSSSPTATASPTAIDLAHGPEQQKLAVDTGYWPLYRYDPRKLQDGPERAPPRLGDAQGEGHRLRPQRDPLPMVEQQDPERFKQLMGRAQHGIEERFALYQHLAKPVEHAAAPAKAPVLATGKEPVTVTAKEPVTVTAKEPVMVTAKEPVAATATAPAGASAAKNGERP